ncbi:unnamed protein product [Angiostrongylus costaricensis]|uniref:GPN-loop GTPase 2 n=1 Tax=Angiostrongylus costaricensis TaxID=334426 RepID=A0A0R3PT73_ANGCS|nr:unnamed protein product [Angiostrongylus costaricensis]
MLLGVVCDQDAFDDFFRLIGDHNVLQNTQENTKDVPGLERYHALNTAICDVLSNFDMVNFVPLNVQRKEDMANVLRLADSANGWAFHDHRSSGARPVSTPEFAEADAFAVSAVKILECEGCQ